MRLGSKMTASDQITLINSDNNSIKVNWKEIWENKDLIYFLTWRDIKVRYKQTLLGILWIILQPLFSMVLFTFVFGNYAKVPSDGIPYPIFVFIGLLFWNFFSSILTNASNSIVASENILKKVYFPRIIAPIAATLSCIVDLIPTIMILLVMMVVYKVHLTLGFILITPVLFLLVFIAGLGLGLIFAPINARFRDVRYVLPYFIQLGLFVTPVIYPATLFGGTSKILRMINPVAEAIEVFRSLLFGTRSIEWQVFLTAVVITIIVFMVGVNIFKRNERTFIDIL